MILTPLSIVSMSPPEYPSAWLRPRSARFRFVRQDHCSSATTRRFLNMRLARDFARTHSGQTRITDSVNDEAISKKGELGSRSRLVLSRPAAAHPLRF